MRFFCRPLLLSALCLLPLLTGCAVAPLDRAKKAVKVAVLADLAFSEDAPKQAARIVKTAEEVKAGVEFADLSDLNQVAYALVLQKLGPDEQLRAELITETVVYCIYEIFGLDVGVPIPPELFPEVRAAINDLADTAIATAKPYARK